MIQIIEIIGRAHQGVTKPFLCKCDDDYFYYVKGTGSHAGHRSLLAEWISAHLAREFGLPIAPFQLVDVPEILIEIVSPEWASLGSGTAFASEQQTFVQELQWSQIKQVPIELQQDILVFDWWIHNADRSLTDKGGNPNLLWDTQEKKLAVIDHNNAFDLGFHPTEFCESHVFRAQIPAVFEDCVVRATYTERMERAFAAFETACNNSPLNWWWIGDGVPCSFNKDEARRLLARFDDQSFWGIAS
jgi:hypothetical protein